MITICFKFLHWSKNVNIIKLITFLQPKIYVKILLAIYKKYQEVYLIITPESLTMTGTQYKIHIKTCLQSQIRNMIYTIFCILIKAIKIQFFSQIRMRLMKDMLLIISQITHGTTITCLMSLIHLLSWRESLMSEMEHSVNIYG